MNCYPRLEHTQLLRRQLAFDHLPVGDGDNGLIPLVFDMQMWQMMLLGTNAPQPVFPSRAEGCVQPVAVAPLPGREADGRLAPSGAGYSR